MSEADDTPAEAPPSPLFGLGLAATYLALSALWIVMAILGFGAVLAVVAMRQGLDAANLDNAAALELMGPGTIAIGTFFQTGGLVAIAIGLAGYLDREHAPPERIRRVFALTPTSRAPYVVAGLGAFTVGLFPTWVAETLRASFPALEMGTLDMVNDMVTGGPLAGRILMLVAVVVMAPICEELVFRGFLWRALEESLPPWAVFVTTSVLFAAYHVDPVHVTAVLFTGGFLGWLRWWSGSLWPCVVAHFLNNAIASVGMVATGGAPQVELPFWAGLLGGVATVGLCVAGWAATRPKEDAT